MAEKEYIEREYMEEIITMLKSEKGDIRVMDTETLLYFIRKVPAADVAPVKHGHWTEIDHSENFGDYHFVCSECKCNTPDRAYVVAPDFCPNCGARMDGDTE